MAGRWRPRRWWMVAMTLSASASRRGSPVSRVAVDRGANGHGDRLAVAVADLAVQGHGAGEVVEGVAKLAKIVIRLAEVAEGDGFPHMSLDAPVQRHRLAVVFGSLGQQSQMPVHDAQVRQVASLATAPAGLPVEGQRLRQLVGCFG